jgi:hypothetical protein
MWGGPGNIPRNTPLLSTYKRRAPPPSLEQHLEGTRAPHKSNIPKGLGPSSYLELWGRDEREEYGEELGLSVSPPCTSTNTCASTGFSARWVFVILIVLSLWIVKLYFYLFSGSSSVLRADILVIGLLIKTNVPSYH